MTLKSRETHTRFSIWGGVDIVRQNWGGIDAGPLHWEGCSPTHLKVGWTHLWLKCSRFRAPPLSVFLAPFLSPNFNFSKSVYFSMT